MAEALIREIPVRLGELLASYLLLALVVWGLSGRRSRIPDSPGRVQRAGREKA